MNNSSFLFNFLIFIYNLSFHITSPFIVLPFKTYHSKNSFIEQELNITTFFNNFFINEIYSNIEIGNPKEVVPIKITSNSHGLEIGYLCDNIFESKESSYNNKSFTFYRESEGLITYPQYKGGYYAKDSFSFYTDLEQNNKNKKIVNNISFIYMPKYESNNEKNEKVCGILGLSLKYNNYCEEQRNIMTNLNKLDVLHNYAYSIHYKNNNEGFILLGEELHNAIPDLFNEENLRRTNALSDGYDAMEWKTEFMQIYFYDKGVKRKLTETKKAKFAIEINYIVGTNNYKNNIENFFFEKYLENNICHYEKIQGHRYSVLICNKDSSFDINSFPNLFFFHRIFNYTFEFTKEELFLEKNNKYIFLVFFTDYNINYFALGKLFLKKYLLVFNQDTKTIGFYNSELKNEKNNGKINLFIEILGIILIIICSIIGFHLAKKIYEHTRKKRINEINEQYEYNSYESKNINQGNDKSNILLEMPNKL